MWGGLSADRAVDGRYGSVNGDQRYCAHPDNRVNDNKPAEWWVDLQDTYLVDNVTIYNTYDSRGKSYNICQIMIMNLFIDIIHMSLKMLLSKITLIKQVFSY